MKFTAAVLALAAGAAAFANNATTSAGANVVYTTEIVTALTTYCPEATTVTHGGSTITVTEATTLTLEPCTIVRPITTVSSVICQECPPPPVYHNSTGPAVPTSAAATSAVPIQTPIQTPIGTISHIVPQPTTTGPVTGGAGKVAAAGLAGVLGFAALLL
ncbi:hypothetical protein BT67DRAFT_436470 [Trichocladium antarcticum]|uniref:Clock-controlled protein 6 n=1 Tax=Trichocladium antarcticum TaxID=1450529 RepID=A0AAN6UDQ2_9PEZI|nr:hypothetical protein BT67DRAFT_436470 [Trichocladium antarcticum]